MSTSMTNTKSPDVEVSDKRSNATRATGALRTPVDTNVSAAQSDQEAQSKAAHIATAAHAAIDSIEKKAVDAEQILRDQAAQLASKGGDASSQALDFAEEAKTRATSYIEEKPVQSLAIAFGVGALIATLLRK